MASGDRITAYVDIKTKQSEIQLSTLRNQIVKTYDKIDGLRSKIDALENAKIPTQEYKEITNQISKAKSALDKLIEKQEQMKSSGKTGTDSWNILQRKIKETKKEISFAKRDLKDLVDAGKDFTLGKDSAEYAKLSQELNYQLSQQDIQAQKHDLLKQKIARQTKEAGKLGKVFSNIGRIIKSRLTDEMSKFNKSSRGSTNGLQNGFKNLLKYGFGIRSLYVLVNKLRSAIKEGFGNLYEANLDGFKNQVDGLKASLTTLKNAFAAAFSPIVSAVIPYLQQFISWITSAVNAIGQLIAALMGQSTYTKAVKQSAAATEKQAKATKKANKEQSKQLSNLDKLNNLTSEKNKEDEDSGAGSGAGGMFKKMPISDKWKNIADWLKSMWEKADFTELGRLLGEKLNDALNKIPWDKIKNTAFKIGKSIATFINGFVEVEGLGFNIGRNIAEAINTGITGIGAFLDYTHWDSVGKFIGEGFNGLVDTLDWEGLAHIYAQKWNAVFETLYNIFATFDWKKFGDSLAKYVMTVVREFDFKNIAGALSEYAKGLLDTIIGFFEGIDWVEVGNKIWDDIVDFVTNIDYAGIIERVAEGIGAVIGGLFGLVCGFAEGVLKDIYDWFYEQMQGGGSFTIEGFFLGILEAIGNIGMWIKEHIFQPFIDGFNKAFKINSPSKVMDEEGGFIMQGLLGGITAKIDSLLQKAKEIKDKFLSKFDDFKEKMKSVGSKIIDGIIEGIKAGWEKISSWASKIGDLFSFNIKTNGVSAGGQTSSIPGYATGQVIPASMRRHIAVLGDNNRETEVVSPLSTMKQAFMEAMQEMGGMNGNSEIHIHLDVDGKQVAKTVWRNTTNEVKRTGNLPFRTPATT